MKSIKNKFILIYIFSILMLTIILFASVPFDNFLKKTISDNDIVKNQVIINPEAKSPKVIDRIMTIKFNALVDSSLEWDFKALQESINIKIGESKIVRYEGTNLSNRVIISTANFIASPELIFPYLIKTECFCFTEQKLKPGETKIFTMVFFLDPALDSDSNLNKIKELVFTYEFSEYKS